jgi:NNP family nitrate/nitrite transporter-like MFS transporter
LTDNDKLDYRKKMNENVASLRSQIGPLLLMTGIFFLNFIARIILAPLMPTIELDLGIGHAESGYLFLLISLGYFTSLMGSGFFSSRFTHRKTIIFSSMFLGITLLAVSFSDTLWEIRIGCIIVGLAAGLYLPSGISTLTSLVRSEDWGKAIAIHELAPNISFLAAPLISEAFLVWFTWRNILALLGLASLFVGLTFALFGKGGDFPGEPPSPSNVKSLLREPSFWVMIVFFSLGISGSLGIYTMLPLYLVSQRGMTQSWANYLVALSRVSGLGVAFLSGMVTDKIGPKVALGGVLLFTGFLSLLLGIVPGSWVVLIVFLQPLIAVCFFPPGFAALSRIGPPHVRNISVSLTVPFAFLVGGGAVPIGIGFFGDKVSFDLGIALVGIIIMGGFILLRYLRFPDE